MYIRSDPISKSEYFHRSAVLDLHLVLVILLKTPRGVVREACIVYRSGIDLNFVHILSLDLKFNLQLLQSP